jgi:hypothetical protein
VATAAVFAHWKISAFFASLRPMMAPSGDEESPKGEVLFIEAKLVRSQAGSAGS